MTERKVDSREKKEILEQTVIDTDKLDKAPGEKTLAEKLKEKKAKERVKNIKKYSILTFLALFSYAVYFLFKPFTGTLPYGICKTFIELHVPYPETILLSEVSTTRKGGVRIWFAYIDSFGSYRLEPFVCVFRANAQGATYLAEAKLGKLDIDPVKVELFNKAIPYLATNPPDLTIPTPIPDSLDSIQFDFNRFRRPIL